jgi:hypothetical protein
VARDSAKLLLKRLLVFVAAEFASGFDKAIKLFFVARAILVRLTLAATVPS